MIDVIRHRRALGCPPGPELGRAFRRRRGISAAAAAITAVARADALTACPDRLSIDRVGIAAEEHTGLRVVLRCGI